MLGRIPIILLVVFALLVVPLFNTHAQTGPWYYCSATRTTGGNGTYYDPWACSNQSQLNTVTDTICRLGGGSLYRIFTGSYVIYYVNYTANGCTVTQDGEYTGYPPNTGPDVPLPLIIGGVVSIGLLFVAAGLMLRRRSVAA
jgi:hypothetical protein